MREFLLLFRADSIWSVPLRGIIWLVAVTILAAGIDKGRQRSEIKADVGWFFLILGAIAIVSYLIFGFAPTF